MLSDEIRSFVGETDKLDELEAILDKADALENVLAETQKKVEEKDAELAKKNRKLADYVLSESAKVKSRDERIKSGEIDLDDMSEDEFKAAMNKIYGEGTFKETSSLDDLL